MKKFALATILALSTTSAFAGFNGNTTPKQALKAADNSMITLEGNITQQIDDDEFLFTDGTAQIKVEIKRRAWNGLNVGPNDKIRISGKLDNEAFEKAELEVYRVEKAR